MNIEHPDELRAYLQTRFPQIAGSPIVMQPLAGGVSNRTVLVRIGDSAGIVFKQALSKLRVEVDWRCDPARIHREAAGLQALGKLLPPGATPQFLFEDFDERLLAMSEVLEPYENWKTRLLQFGPTDEHITTAATLLAAMHRGAFVRQAEFHNEFRDTSFFEVLRLEPYYGFAAEQVSEASEFLTQLQGDTLSRKLTLVHGDFSPKNILLQPDNMVLLDHEVIHWGDPAFDVGFFLTHLLSKAHHLLPVRESFRSAACLFWNNYHRAVSSVSWSDGLEQEVVRHTLACLLARARGRSQLEYLSETERERQTKVGVRLMRDLPHSLESLTDRFVAHLND